jgi:hypothetical protein
MKIERYSYKNRAADGHSIAQPALWLCSGFRSLQLFSKVVRLPLKLSGHNQNNRGADPTRGIAALTALITTSPKTPAPSAYHGIRCHAEAHVGHALSEEMLLEEWQR